MSYGLTMQGMLPCNLLNNYAASALLSDYGDTFGSYLPSCGMPIGGCFGTNPMMGGFPMMGGAYGGDIDTYLKQMEKLQEYEINSQIRRKQLTERAQVQMTGDDNVINARVAALQRSIHNNDQDNVLQNYNALVQAVKQKSATNNGGVSSDDARSNAIARAAAQQVYFNATGMPLGEDIIQNGSGTFLHGIKEGLCLGSITNKRTAEENIAVIEQTPLPQNHNLRRKAGNIFGPVAAGAGAGAIAGIWLGPIGAGIGAGIGAAVGLVAGIITACKQKS